jgi:succinoglycan biosynthesis transport protein ExoP
LQRFNEIGVAVMSKATNVQILDKATYPGSPCKPNKPRNILLAIVFGLGGGIGLAFLLDYFDNTFRDTDEIEKSLHLPSIGMIPLNKEMHSPAHPMIGTGPERSFAELFRSMSTFILLSSPESPPKTILITSPGEKEGKSTISANIASALVESLGNGIIIDADMRKPRLHHTFGTGNKQGLSTYLSGNTEFKGVDGILIKPTPVKGLNLMTSGPIPPNPSELLFSQRMKDLMDSLYSLYNFVIIDAPPVMGMPDSLFLSSIVDGTILVVKAGETPKNALLETKKIFSNVNSKLLGVVLNGVKKTDLKYGYYSRYFYSYLDK